MLLGSIASQFRPSAAKAIYQHFKAENVLDFSAGWGDRLNGFMACEHTKLYVGCDPNDRLHEGYQKQIKLFNTGKDITIHNSPAEDVDFGEDNFELVFTSPPYFDIERYTQEGNQSWKRYRKLDDWLNNFLFTVLDKAWKALKSGGHMVINISDVYSHHTINKMCDPMCNYMKNKQDCKFLGGLGLRLTKRPRSNSSKDGIYGEPIWVFKKL